MSTLIANPIYDSVFKYMTANDKVAKILLPNDNVKNRAEELFQVLNQSHKSADGHFINIDESQYSDDEGITEIIRILKGAACDSEVRRTMMLEDEILRDLKDLNLTVRMQKKQLAKQNETLISSVKLLASMNLSVDMIAAKFGIDEKDVIKMLDKTI